MACSRASVLRCVPRLICFSVKRANQRSTENRVTEFTLRWTVKLRGK